MEVLELDYAIDHFNRHYLSTSKLSAKTQAEYLAILRDFSDHCSRHLQTTMVSSIVSYHLRNYLSSIEHIGDSKWNRRIAALKSFFSYLEFEGLLPLNPTFDLKYIPKKNRDFNRRRLGELWGGIDDVQPTKTLSPTELAYTPHSISAHEIKAHLDTKVVGQELAKIQISVLLSMHLNWFSEENRMHRSPNAIVIGPTGVGKTHTLRIASEFLEIPFIAVDTTSLVEAGIVGLQIEDVISDLVREADSILDRGGRPRSQDDDIALARQGIVFFDEFDKINFGTSGANQLMGNNLSVQRRLLKFTDGGILGVGVRRHQGNDPLRSIDTAGILMVAGGAFVGIDDNKNRSKRPAELQRELSRASPNVIVSADIVNYGFMPELVARLPVIVEYGPLSKDDLERILAIPEISPIQVWIEHFKRLGKVLNVTPDAKTYAAEKATVLKMGARGLHQVLFPVLADLAYEIEASAQEEYTVDAKKLSEVFLRERSASNTNG